MRAQAIQMTLILGLVAALLVTGLGPKERVEASPGAEPYLGEVMLFAGNFPPRGWALCDGRILKISQYTALFSLLGTTYGGDGRSTFGLPDLRGRVPMGAGQGAGLSNRRWGTKSGQEDFEWRLNPVPVQRDVFLKKEEATPENAGYLLAPPAKQTHQSTMPPHLTMHYCIALQGIYPSRN